MMNPFTGWYRKFSRYTTVVLGALTIALGTYAWLNRTQVYYETYCEEEEIIRVQQRFSNAYDCDVAVSEYLEQENNTCPKVGCRKVIK